MSVPGDHSLGDDRRYDVLLVEPDPGAVSPFIDAFEATDATEAVHVVSDGDEALDFLNRRGDHAAAPRPDLVLLDLEIPGASGERILRELDDRAELRPVPVLVVTASELEEDVARSYELNANAYLQKPTTAEEFESLSRTIEEFWLEHAHLPPK